MAGLKNTEIECSTPGCPNTCVTSDTGDLPPGWDYQLVQSEETGEVYLQPFCPDCSNF
jgi:hypothetical protein